MIWIWTTNMRIAGARFHYRTLKGAASGSTVMLRLQAPVPSPPRLTLSVIPA